MDILVGGASSLKSHPHGEQFPHRRPTPPFVLRVKCSAGTKLTCEDVPLRFAKFSLSLSFFLHVNLLTYQRTLPDVKVPLKSETNDFKESMAPLAAKSAHRASLHHNGEVEMRQCFGRN